MEEGRLFQGYDVKQWRLYTCVAGVIKSPDIPLGMLESRSLEFLQEALDAHLKSARLQTNRCADEEIKSCRSNWGM
jgi:hypothetical protein